MLISKQDLALAIAITSDKSIRQAALNNVAIFDGILYATDGHRAIRIPRRGSEHKGKGMIHFKDLKAIAKMTPTTIEGSKFFRIDPEMLGDLSGYPQNVTKLFPEPSAEALGKGQDEAFYTAVTAPGLACLEFWNDGTSLKTATHEAGQSTYSQTPDGLSASLDIGRKAIAFNRALLEPIAFLNWTHIWTDASTIQFRGEGGRAACLYTVTNLQRHPAFAW